MRVLGLLGSGTDGSEGGEEVLEAGLEVREEEEESLA